MKPNFYANYYSESSFWKKLGRYARKAGMNVVYPALLLYHMITDSEVPVKTKAYIAAGLGYFILPTDVIPDLAPLIGYTDDLSVLLLTISLVQESITEKHKLQARETLKRWFKNIDEKKIEAIEQKLEK